MQSPLISVEVNGNNKTNSFQFSETKQNMESLIAFILFASLFFLIYIFVKEIKKQKKTKAKYKLDTGLNKKLLTMLSGDEKAALRLIRNVRQNNPGKSYIWYQEKVIRDLERDRRC